MKHIGLITALLPEARCLIGNRIQPETLVAVDDYTTLMVCGIGAERAKRAAERMLDAGMEILISWGTAGALVNDIQPGDLIIPETIIANGGKIYQTAKYLRISIVHQLRDCPGNIFLGQLADSIYVLTNIAAKTSLHRHSGSLAVDMESAAIAEVAARHEVQYVAIRAITDSVEMALPDELMNFINAYGQVRFRKLFATLLAHPGHISHLLKLTAGFRAATKTLKWIGQRRNQVLRN